MCLVMDRPFPSLFYLAWHSVGDPQREKVANRSLFEFISSCHGRSGLGISVSTCFGSETVDYGVFIISWSHVIMCTHYFVISVCLRNPLKNHSIMWQIGWFYPCFFRMKLVYGFLQQYQRNKGVTNRVGCHNRNGRHSLWSVLPSKQKA